MLTNLHKIAKYAAYKPILILKSLNPFPKTRPIHFFVPDIWRFSKFIKLIQSQNLGHLFSVSCLPRQLANGKKSFLAIDLNCFEDLSKPNRLFQHDALNYLKNHDNLCLFYDLSNECLTFSNDDPEAERNLLTFHQLLTNAGVDNKKVFLLCSNATPSDIYARWVEKHGIQNPIQILGYSYVFYSFNWQLNISYWFQNTKHKLLNIATNTPQKIREKYFSSLMLKSRPHRQAMMLMLASENLLEKGLVVFQGESYILDTPWFDQFVRTLKNGEALLEQNQNLYNKLPITFDRNMDEIKKDAWQVRPGKIKFLFPELYKTGQIEEILSYFEIVTETYFTSENNIYITEKTIRPILRFQPFIMVGSPHTLSYLKRFGFKTFSPLINEEYDAIENPTKRLDAIFEEIQRLLALPKEELHKLYCNLLPLLEHNFYHFLNNTRAMCLREVEENIIKKISRAYFRRIW